MPEAPSIPDPATDLKKKAFAAASGLDRLSAKAAQVDLSMRPGSHGRRRAGIGEEFWQFRAAADGDPLRSVDWRRSAKSDGHFVLDREMQNSNCVILWADISRSMQFTGESKRPEKADRARLIALAAAILFAGAEERVGVLGSGGSPAAGMRQIDRMAAEFLHESDSEFGLPPPADLQKGARLILVSDFLAPIDGIAAAIEPLAERRAQGALVQVLDPAELSFPYGGRTLFSSMSGSVSFESFDAGGLRAAYQKRLRERMDAVRQLAGRFGWRSRLHLTDTDVRPTLHWLCSSALLGQ